MPTPSETKLTGKELEEATSEFFKEVGKENPDLTRIRKLLNSGVDVNSKTKDGYCALEEMYYCPNIGLMELLIHEFKADINCGRGKALNKVVSKASEKCQTIGNAMVMLIKDKNDLHKTYGVDSLLDDAIKLYNSKGNSQALDVLFGIPGTDLNEEIAGYDKKGTKEMAEMADALRQYQKSRQTVVPQQDSGKKMEKILLDIIEGKIKPEEGTPALDELKKAGGRASKSFNRAHRYTWVNSTLYGTPDFNYLLDKYAVPLGDKEDL